MRHSGSVATMNRARTALVILGSAALVVGLAGCSKPTPGASVFSGTTSQFRHAVCWAFDADTIDPKVCAQDVIAKAVSGPGVATIPVVPGETIGISVDPVVADAGWFPVIGDQRLTQSPITSTYYRFTFPDLQEVPAEGLTLQIVAGQDDKTRGIWVYQLVPA